MPRLLRFRIEIANSRPDFAVRNGLFTVPFLLLSILRHIQTSQNPAGPPTIDGVRCSLALTSSWIATVVFNSLLGVRFNSRRVFRWGCFVCPSRFAGKLKVKTEPRPAQLTTRMVPPCAWAIIFGIGRPMGAWHAIPYILSSIEFLEDMLDFLFFDPRPLVRDANVMELVTLLGRDRDGLTRGRVELRVGDELN